jgi:multiple antibiotic resistance protein
MIEEIRNFWICFVTLFVAMDAAGILPLFMSLTEGADAQQKKTIILQSVTSALIVALAFIVCGPLLLRLMGVTIPDFMIAGGLLLLAISLSDLLSGEKKLRQVDATSLGAVPIGVPLITGPAVLAACLLLTNHYGHLIVAIALVFNILFVTLLLRLAQPISEKLGRTGTRMFSKIASMLLAAFAVMLVRKGFIDILLSNKF